MSVKVEGMGYIHFHVCSEAEMPWSIHGT